MDHRDCGRADNFPHGCPVDFQRRDEGGDYRDSAFDAEACHLGRSAKIFHAVFLRKLEASAETLAEAVAVNHQGLLSTNVGKMVSEAFGECRFAGARKPKKPKNVGVTARGSVSFFHCQSLRDIAELRKSWPMWWDATNSAVSG
jgi:hypothetical protein